MKTSFFFFSRFLFLEAMDHIEKFTKFQIVKLKSFKIEQKLNLKNVGHISPQKDANQTLKDEAKSGFALVLASSVWTVPEPGSGFLSLTS